MPLPLPFIGAAVASPLAPLVAVAAAAVGAVFLVEGWFDLSVETPKGLKVRARGGVRTVRQRSVRVGR